MSQRTLWLCCILAPLPELETFKGDTDAFEKRYERARTQKFMRAVSKLGGVSEEDPACVYPFMTTNKDGTPLSLAIVTPSDPKSPFFDRYINMMARVGELYAHPVTVDGKKVGIIKRQLYTIPDFAKLSRSIALFIVRQWLTVFRTLAAPPDSDQCPANLVNLRDAMKSAVQRYWNILHLFNEPAQEDPARWRFDSEYKNIQITKWPGDTWRYQWSDSSAIPPAVEQDELDDEMFFFERFIKLSLLPDGTCKSAWVRAKPGETQSNHRLRPLAQPHKLPQPDE
ncbi:hypothetical protein FRB99_002998 [Tulasnella sp. 403]|nr:hypothetical protein FRB99_002998 [Tulasnella sp. 403]